MGSGSVTVENGHDDVIHDLTFRPSDPKNG